VSETGVLLYESSGVGRNNQMLWYDRGGKLLETTGTAGPVWEPAIAPDEKSVVFRRTSLASEKADLWLRDLARGAEQRFTTDASINLGPVWSPKGDRIAFDSNREGGMFNLYQKAATGAGEDEKLLAIGHNIFISQWSRDGRFIVFQVPDAKTKFDIWVLPMDGAEQKPVPFLRSQFNEVLGQLSPDGHWMAYTSDESGQREVYVQPFPGTGGQKRISIAGGEQPRWRGDGKELFFVGGDRKMMAVVVEAIAGPKPTLEVEAPRPLFDSHLAQTIFSPAFEYDVTADGKRFLLNTIAGGTSAPLLNVVLNWDTGLKK
jgi:Tol biopolymer transport system component